MFIVAIANLATPIDAEAAALASDLGATAYEARMLLAGGMPAVVRTTPDKAAALDLLSKLRARGHAALACEAAAVVASGDMVSMRRLRLNDSDVTLDDRPGESLPYDDVLALLPALHRSRSQTQTETKETKFSAGRAILTGGFAMTKTVKATSRTATEERTNVLYVFRRSGATPWLLNEHGTAWTGLGRAPAASAYENFRAAVAMLRERAPGATYDDRLLSRKAAPERSSLSGGAGSSHMTVRTSSESGVDLLAHLLAMAIAREAYRTPAT